MNKVILLGRMTRDAEVRRGESDSIFARFSLAVDRRFYQLCGIWQDCRVLGEVWS